MTELPTEYRNRDLDALRQVPARIAALLERHVQKREEIAARSLGVSLYATSNDIAAARQRAQADMDAERERAQAELDALRAEVERRKGAVAQAIAATLRRPAPSEQAALVREIREQRAWQRAERQLDRCDAFAVPVEVRALCDRALADPEGADDTLGALRAELSAYLAGRGAAELGPEAVAAVDAATRAARPDAGAALDARAELEVGCNRVQVGLGHAAYALARGDLSVTIPGWDRGATTVALAKPVDA